MKITLKKQKSVFIVRRGEQVVPFPTLSEAFEFIFAVRDAESNDSIPILNAPNRFETVKR